MISETNLEIIEENSLDAAYEAAAYEAKGTRKSLFKVTAIKQGSRVFLSAVLPINEVIHIIKNDPVVTEKNKVSSLDSVRDAYNRPVNSNHVNSVSEYLYSNAKGKYILPTLIVCVVSKTKVFIYKDKDEVSGYLVMNIASTNLSVVDGQHRLRGLIDAIERLRNDGKNDEAESLSKDQVLITFSFESNKSQIHQDFADCSKTKPLPKSMIALYDQRHPVNRLTMDFIDSCPLFNDGKTDPASSTHSTNSRAIILVSGIRTILKALFKGQFSMSDDSFDKYTSEILNHDDIRQKKLIDMTNYINILTENNKVLKKISLLSHNERSVIPKLRNKHLIASPAGLVLCASVIHELENKEDHSFNINEKIKELAAINWKKSNQMWHGNIITCQGDNYSINSSNKAMEVAIQKVIELIGKNKQSELPLNNV